MIKWERIKEETVELKVNEININQWTTIQLTNLLFLKQSINDKPLPKTKKCLINLRVEWKEISESDWNFVKEQVEED